VEEPERGASLRSPGPCDALRHGLFGAQGADLVRGEAERRQDLVGVRAHARGRPLHLRVGAAEARGRARLADAFVFEEHSARNVVRMGSRFCRGEDRREADVAAPRTCAASDCAAVT
jgi:hypothetical protein